MKAAHSFFLFLGGRGILRMCEKKTARRGKCFGETEQKKVTALLCFTLRLFSCNRETISLTRTKEKWGLLIISIPRRILCFTNCLLGEAAPI